MNFGRHLKMRTIRKYFYRLGGTLTHDGSLSTFRHASFGRSAVSRSEVGSTFVLNECENLFLLDELFLGHLKSMGPSSIDAEIRSLGPSAGGDVKLVEAFMLFLEYQLQLRRDFEFTEGVMGLFLKVYYILIHIQILLLGSNFQAGGGSGQTQFEDFRP